MSQRYLDTKKLQINKAKQCNFHAVYTRHLFECFNHLGLFKSTFILHYLQEWNISLSRPFRL